MFNLTFIVRYIDILRNGMLYTELEGGALHPLTHCIEGFTKITRKNLFSLSLLITLE